jgi:hypothetical protein
VRLAEGHERPRDKANSYSFDRREILGSQPYSLGCRIGIVRLRSSISCGGRAIVDLLDLISLEVSGRKRIVTTIKGISPATFLDGTHDQVTVLLRTDGV